MKSRILIFVFFGFVIFSFMFGLFDNKSFKKSPFNAPKSNLNGSNNSDNNQTEGNDSNVVIDDKYVPVGNIEINNFITSIGKKMLVLGKTGCTHCKNFKPLVDGYSYEYSFQYLYVDIAKLSSIDYDSLMNSHLVIPEKCRRTNNNVYLSDGFGTPLTLFIENEKVYDCIRGYVDANTLYSNLINAGIIY